MDAVVILLGVALVLLAFADLVNTALVIGYLPSLYGAYSAREQKLMTLDDGSDDRITPTNLVMARAPDADTDRLNARFAEWENWVTSVLETHTTLPLLQLPYDEAREIAGLFRNRFSRELEYLIDAMLCPRGFWAPDLGMASQFDMRTQSQ